MNLAMYHLSLVVCGHGELVSLYRAKNQHGHWIPWMSTSGKYVHYVFLWLDVSDVHVSTAIIVFRLVLR